MKIKFCAGWVPSEEITKRLITQFKTPDIDLSDIEFVYDDAYDVIVFNNYVTEEPKKGSRACVFFHEPSWSGSHQKNYGDYENFTVFGHYKELYSANNIVEIPSHLFYGGRGPWCEGWDFWSYDNITNSKFKKTKGISSVVSNLGIGNDNHPNGCLYNERCGLISKLIDEIPLKELQKMIGHSSSFNTSTVYAHVFKKDSNNSEIIDNKIRDYLPKSTAK
jgi:hypothetical protein